MKMYVLKKLGIGLLGVIYFIQPSYGSNKDYFSLEDAIRIAQNNSLAMKNSNLEFQLKKLDFERYKISLYPTLNLNATVPQYSKSLSRLTLPNGEDTFVSQHQSYNQVVLSLEQVIPWTGGSLQIHSIIDRIDGLGKNSYTNFAIQPYIIRFYQDRIGFNDYKWRKRIANKQYEISQKQFVQDKEVIAYNTVLYYFEGLLAQTEYKIALEYQQHNLSLMETYEKRFKLGNISKAEYLQLRLNFLNSTQKVFQDSIKLEFHKNKLRDFLNTDSLKFNEFEIPHMLHYIPIDYQEMLIYTEKHGIQALNSNFQKLEATQNLKRVKSENKIKISLSAHFGTSSLAHDFHNLGKGMGREQHISVGISFPIIDWRLSKVNQEIAEKKIQLTQNEIEKSKLQVEQDLLYNINNWNLFQNQLLLAQESKKVAEENYQIEYERFLKGYIALADLNRAQQAKEFALLSYIQNLKAYWETYYQLRMMSLYDFLKETALN